MHHSLHQLLLFCIAILLLATALASARRHHHQKRVVEDNSDYEYRDVTDYSSGVFVDAVPITKKASEGAPEEDAKHSTATTAADNKAFHRTNRYPARKLRKFADDTEAEARRQWYETLFAQRRRK